MLDSSWTSKDRKHVRDFANVRYCSQYAKLRDVLISSFTPKHYNAQFMPKQLRGPFENETSQLSKTDRADTCGRSAAIWCHNTRCHSSMPDAACRQLWARAPFSYRFQKRSLLDRTSSFLDWPGWLQPESKVCLFPGRVQVSASIRQIVTLARGSFPS